MMPLTRSRLLPAGLALALVCAPLANARAGAVLSPTNQKITDAGHLDWVGEPDLARQGNALFAVWRDSRRTDSLVEADIFFASSADGGATWGQNRRASDPDFVGFTNRPAVGVAANGRIWVTWGLDACYDTGITCGGSGGLNNDVRIATSVDGGQSWTEGQVWNGTAASIGDDVNQRPQIHADDDRVYVLVHDPTFAGGNVIGFDIVLTFSTLSGNTLNTTTRFLTPAGQSTGKLNQTEGTLTALAVRGSTVCAAWEDQRDTFSIYGTCSTDRGATFPAATRWSVNGNDSEPKLAFGPDGRLYLAYKDAEQKDIHVRASTNNGAAWSDARPATAVGANYTYDYDLAVGPDNQLVLPVAVGATSGRDQSDLLMVTSIDGGQTFGTVGPVEAGTEEFLRISTQSSISVVTGGPANDAQAYVAWRDDRNPASPGPQTAIYGASARLDAVPPSAPANLRASGGDTSILLEWSASSDANGVAYYNIVRATSAGGPYAPINARPVTQTFYRDVGLPAGTYFYRVTAIDGTANASAPSNEASAAATVGGTVTGLNGTLAYDLPNGNAGVRPLAAGVPGAEAVITGANTPNFSTDGQRLYYAGSGNTGGTVFVADQTGAGARPLYGTSNPVAFLDLPADQNFLGAVIQDNFNGACIPFEARLIQVTPAITATTTSDTNADSLSISPDRRWLAYTNRVVCNIIGTTLFDSNRLCLIDTTAAGTGLRETCQAPASYLGSDFGNAGNLIVFSANYTGQNEIWRAAVTQTGDLVNLAQLTRGPAGQPSTYPRVSSDGNWVAFLRDIDAGPGETLQVHVVRADGDSVRSLGFSAGSIAWSGGGPGGPVVGLNQRIYLPRLGK